MGKDLERLLRAEERKLTPRASNTLARSEKNILISLDWDSFLFCFVLFCFAFCSFLEVSFVVVFSLLISQLMQNLEPGIRQGNKKLPLDKSFYSITIKYV